MDMQQNKLVDMLSQILQHKVSDIHVAQDRNISIRNATGKIAFLENTLVTKEEIWGFLNTMLGANQIDSLLEWHEQDVASKIGNYYLRINAYLDRMWINLAIRKITSQSPTLDQIWIPNQLKDIFLKDKWLIVVTWPTGSWKSTTLASIIDYINSNRACHIITLEDPIEYVFENKKSLITQREIGKSSPSWWNAIKYALRQDPDVIMVWEMRDVETISAVLTLVETWHLVLSTLHTIDAAQTISRIIDVFPSAKQEQIAMQLSLWLELVISQRLLEKKDGSGKVAVRDILTNTKAVANNIRERKIHLLSSIIETGAKYGMKSMDRSMAELVLNWSVDINVALQKVSNPETFKSLVQNINANAWFTPLD